MRINDIQQFINSETGEVIELKGDTSDYIIRHRKQNEGYKKKLEVWNNSFYWANMDKIKEMNFSKKLKEDKELTLSILGGVLVLGCYINSENVLICKQDKDKTHYNRKKLQQLLKLKDRTFCTFIKVVKRYGIIDEYNKKYMFSSDFHYIGKNPTANSYVRIYKKGILALSRSNVSLDRIGFLYLAMPYLEYTQCGLCFESLKCEIKDIKPLQQKELQLMVGCSKGTIIKYLGTKFTYRETTSKEDLMVKLFCRTKLETGESMLVVNPLILRRSLGSKGNIRYIDLNDGFKIMS